MLKCLIWDLDDTLWQGTLNEDGEITFTEERRRLVVCLDERGILQSIASRNAPESVLRKLEELGIKQYFLYPQCRFESKVESIKTIVELLNIGMDAAGYIDDNPFELFEIRYFLPEVRVYQAEECQNLLEYPEFQPGKITREASSRRRMMAARQERENAARSFIGSREAFLKECRMELMVRLAQTADIDRIIELAGRTNQLNNLKEQLEAETVLDYLHHETNKVLVAELTDRFGEHGIVGVCFLEVEPPAVLLKLFCISCRVEGRGIGVAFLGEVLNRIQAEVQAVNEINCLFKASEKNRPALMLLKILGFKLQHRKEKFSIYSLPLPHPVTKPEWISLI